MLCLGEQIPGCQICGGGLVGQHDQLAGTGQRFDPHLAEQTTLGLLDVRVAGTDQHVHGPDRFGAKRHRRNRLGTADRIHLLHPEQCAGGQGGARRRAVAAGRGADRDVGYPRHLRRHDRHHRTRGVGGLTARHVDTDAIDGQRAGADDLALRQLLAGRHRERLGRGQPQVVGKHLERLAHIRGCLVERMLQSPGGQPRVLDVHLVEPGRQPAHSLVAARPHHRHDVRHRPADALTVARRGTQRAHRVGDRPGRDLNRLHRPRL